MIFNDHFSIHDKLNNLLFIINYFLFTLYKRIKIVKLIYSYNIPKTNKKYLEKY